MTGEVRKNRVFGNAARKAQPLFFLFFLFSFLLAASSLLRAAPVTVSTGADSLSTAQPNARRIARDSAGNLYFVYHKTSGTYQIFVSKSINNVASWNDMGGAPVQNVAGSLETV